MDIMVQAFDSIGGVMAPMAIPGEFEPLGSEFGSSPTTRTFRDLNARAITTYVSAWPHCDLRVRQITAVRVHAVDEWIAAMKSI